MGNLTRDPELRYTPSGVAVADVCIAINRVWNNEQNQRQEETTYVDITIWGRQGENAQQFLSKGRGVFVEGRIQMDTWDDKATGQKRSKLKIVAENVQYLPSAKATESSAAARAPRAAAVAAPSSPEDDCDDIPF